VLPRLRPGTAPLEMLVAGTPENRQTENAAVDQGCAAQPGYERRAERSDAKALEVSAA
jgi:hypothetical protein